MGGVSENIVNELN